LRTVSQAMAFYDATMEKRVLSPLQQALAMQPNVLLRRQDLLGEISKLANFSDHQALHTLDMLLKHLDESYNHNPSTAYTALLIMDFCVRNGQMFHQYVFGRYILQKLYSICTNDLTKVSPNHRIQKQFQYRLIGTILQWHQRWCNAPASTLNYTFSRLQQSGTLALYQSYEQTQSLQAQDQSANSQPHSAAITDHSSIPDLPPLPAPHRNLPVDKGQSAPRERAMTSSSAAHPSFPAQSRNRSQSARSPAAEQPASHHRTDPIEHGKSLVHRDGRVTLEYTEKFQTEINELISRYLKPSREILSRPRVSLADERLQKYLRILQTIQQRLVKVISEVKNDDSIVNLAITANDSIVATVQWFNGLVKRSKMAKRNQPFNADKSTLVKQEVLENVDLVGLEQQLLLDGATLFKRKQMRDFKLQKERQQKEEEQRRAAAKPKQMAAGDGKGAVGPMAGSDGMAPFAPQQVQEVQSPPRVAQEVMQQVQAAQSVQSVEAVAAEAVQVDIVSGDMEPEPEQKAFHQAIEPEPEQKVADSAAFNAAVNAAVNEYAVDQRMKEPVAPNVVEADFKEMTLDVDAADNAEVEVEVKAGGDVVDLLNMETMEDGGKIENAESREDAVAMGMQSSAVGNDSDNDVVDPMMDTSTAQGYTMSTMPVSAQSAVSSQ